MLVHIQYLVFLLITWGLLGVGMYRTVVQNYKPQIRKLAALEAIDEGLGLSVETGRKVHCGIPMDGFFAKNAAYIMVGMAIMGYFARKAAALGVDAVYTVCEAPALIVAEGIVRDAYASEGKLDDFNNVDKVQVRLIGLHEAAAYDIATAGILQRDNIGMSLMAGPVGKFSLLQGEAHRAANVFSIVCIPENDKIEWLIPTFDYVLMILESYTAGAMITGDTVHLGNVIGTDYMSWLIFALLIFSFLAGQIGISIAGWT